MSHVLVIDDDPATAESLADMVSLLGHNTKIALGPRKAIVNIKDSLPALILLDLNMPGVSGMEVCRYIKRDPAAKDIPVVFITAEDDPTVIEQAKEAGAVGYLVKPVEFDALETVLAQVIS
jgi:CheY-like chemotaxis protein